MRSQRQEKRLGKRAHAKQDEMNRNRRRNIIRQIECYLEFWASRISVAVLPVLLGMAILVSGCSGSTQPEWPEDLSDCSQGYLESIDALQEGFDLAERFVVVGTAQEPTEISGAVGVISGAGGLEGIEALGITKLHKIRDQVQLAAADCTESEDDIRFWQRVSRFYDRLLASLQTGHGAEASSNGDPHVLTADGLAYDFQAAGEFTAIKSSSSDFEIQVRQEPWAGSTTVTVNTAVAMNVAGDRVGVYVGARDVVHINGRSVRVVKAARLRGGDTSVTSRDWVSSNAWPP